MLEARAHLGVGGEALQAEVAERGAVGGGDVLRAFDALPAKYFDLFPGEGADFRRGQLAPGWLKWI
jgi:hypothetical protein